MQVPTDASASPANSLLLAASPSAPLSSVWRAPSDLTAVEIAIVLSSPALVSRVVLHSGLPQYTPHHTPKVRISLSTTIDQSECTTIGLWDLPSSAAAAHSDTKSNLESELILSYTLPAAAAPCRIVWLKFLLPEIRQPGSAASSSCIWARRIRVYGQKTFGDPTGIDPVTSSGAAAVPMGAVVGGAPGAAVGTMGAAGAAAAGAGGAAAGGTSRWEYQQLLEAPAPMSRSRTPVEGERVWAGGRILELLLPVSSPPISGIRLDALPLDRSAGMFLSLPGAADGGPLARAARGGLMDEWAAFVVPFRLRVSARQDSFGPATYIELPIFRFPPCAASVFSFRPVTPPSAVSAAFSGAPRELEMSRGDDLRRLATAVLRRGLPRTGFTAQGAQNAQSSLRLPRNGLPPPGLCSAPIFPPLAEPPVTSARIPAPLYPPPRIFPATSRFLSCRYASTSVHSTFSASPAAPPAALAAGSAAATKPIEVSGADSLLLSLGLKPLPLFPGSPSLQKESSGSQNQSEDSQEADAKVLKQGQVKRRRGQNLADILWRHPAWGQGARVAKRHWQEGTFYEVSRVQIAKTGRTATVWGIFHQEALPAAVSPLSLSLSPLSLPISSLPFAISSLPFPISSLPFPISSLPFPISSLPFPISSLPFPISSLPFAISSLPFPISSLPFPISSLPFPISSLPFPISSLPFPVSSLPFPVSSLPFPISSLPFPISSLPFPISSLPFPISSLPFPISSLPFPVSSLPFPISSLPFPISSLPFPISSLPFPISSLPFPISSLPFPISSLPFPISSLPFPVSSLPFPISSSLSPSPSLLILTSRGMGVVLAIVSCCYMADNYLVISHPTLCTGVSNATLCSQEFRAARRQLSVLPQAADAVTAAMVSAVAAQVSAIIDAAAEIKRANVRGNHFVNVVADDCSTQGGIALRYLGRTLDAIDSDSAQHDRAFWLSAASTQVENCVDGFKTLAPSATFQPAFVHLEEHALSHWYLLPPIPSQTVANKASDTLEAVVAIAKKAAAGPPELGRKLASSEPADVARGAKWLDDDFVAQLRQLQAELNALGDAVHDQVARRELRHRDDDDDDDDDDDKDKKDKKDKKSKNKNKGSSGGSSSSKSKKDKNKSKGKSKKGSSAKPASGPIRASKGLKANAVVKGKIQSAIDAAPGGSQYVIYIPAGTYREQVVIDTPDIILIGAGAGATVITYDESYGSGSSTFDSATVGVNSDRFVAFGIKFVNTAGPENHQAVAFRATGDQSAAIDCAFEGSQDTLYVDAGRQFYSNCYIGGTQDFIFGDAAAVIEKAKIQLHPSKSFITLTASGRAKDTPTGIVIRDSVVSADKGAAKAYLGRPWKKCAFTVLVNVVLPAVIQPDGWLSWNEGSCMFLAEAGSKGPGAKGSRADWVDPGIISNGASYTAAAFAEVNSWLVLS
ncbi:unnamed protein product [Closterium sp. Yama58-4]|nr:unnamed protein product [Closterium sp. Yama58-4]